MDARRFEPDGTRVPFSCSTSRRYKRNAKICDLCYTPGRKCALRATPHDTENADGSAAFSSAEVASQPDEPSERTQRFVLESVARADPVIDGWKPPGPASWRR